MAGDVRSRLGESLSALLTREQLDTLLDDILATSKKVDADFSCKKCGAAQRHRIEVPDAVAVMKALDMAVNQAFGTPLQTVRHDVNVNVEVASVDGLSLDEIRARKAAILARRPELAGPPEAA